LFIVKNKWKRNKWVKINRFYTLYIIGV
jgi:hypothetical protein